MTGKELYQMYRRQCHEHGTHVCGWLVLPSAKKRVWAGMAQAIKRYASTV